MAAIDFPASPTDGQIFVGGNGVSYQWSAAKAAWLVLAPGAAGQGDFTASGAGAFSGGAYITSQVPAINGNLGGWYNQSNGRYTPPAGRYHLFAYAAFTNGSSTASVGLVWRKNGANAGNSYGYIASVGQNDTCAVELNVDANGTDWFDCQVYSNVGGSSLQLIQFGAFPLGAVPGVAGFGAVSTKFTRFTYPGGTWTPDPKMLSGYAVGMGGGQAGGNAGGAAGYIVGGPGGVSGHKTTKYFNRPLSASYAVTVGAGGAGGGSTPGGDTTITGLLTAPGGGSGTTVVGDADEPGFVGGTLTSLQATGNAYGGVGGGSGGGSGGAVGPGGASNGGNAPPAFGGGGGGGAVSNLATTATGGNGGSGYVNITEFLSA